METGGLADPLNAVGDNGRSRGPYQIMEDYYNDAVQKDPSLRDGDKSYDNVSGAGSKEYSERVIQAYMDRYATEARLGRTATDEDIARIHNGGPNGYKRTSAFYYWIKVQYNYEYGSDGSGDEHSGDKYGSDDDGQDDGYSSSGSGGERRGDERRGDEHSGDKYGSDDEGEDDGYSSSGSGDEYGKFGDDDESNERGRGSNERGRGGNGRGRGSNGRGRGSNGRGRGSNGRGRGSNGRGRGSNGRGRGGKPYLCIA